MSSCLTTEPLLTLELKVLSQLPKLPLPRVTEGFTVQDDWHPSAVPSGLRSPWSTYRKKKEQNELHMIILTVAVTAGTMYVQRLIIKGQPYLPGQPTSYFEACHGKVSLFLSCRVALIGTDWWYTAVISIKGYFNPRDYFCSCQGWHDNIVGELD